MTEANSKRLFTRKRKQPMSPEPRFNMVTPSQPAAPKMDPRLAAAIARGDIVRQKMGTDEGGSISAGEAAHLLGVSKVTVLHRWHRHRLIAWKHGRSVRIPVWQFAGGKMLNGIEETVQILASDDQWRVMRYFLCKRLSLGRRRPLDLLRQGKVAEVIAHAKAHTHAEENTW